MAAMANRLGKLSQDMFVYSRPRLMRAWQVSKVELRPPTPGEVSQALSAAGKGMSNLTSMKWTNYTVRQGFQNTLVGVEVLMWFFIGECIGRRSLIGYNV